MKDLAKVLGVWLLVPAAVGAGNKAKLAPTELSAEHRNASGAFSFRTPESWTVTSLGGSPETVDAQGDGVLVRFLHRGQEAGYDGLHADCMLERLAPAMDTEPRVQYEYDFVSWEAGEHRALDSAFAVHYDAPVLGHREWRQRNLTVVGGGQSLCVIVHCPLEVWKKSPQARALLDGVVRSVRFLPWR
jgi:hypothetical protein